MVALAGRDGARTRELATAAGIPLAFGDWRELVEHPEIDAIAIATLPSLQPDIAVRALELGKPVFAEKPMAADLSGAERMARAADTSRRTTMVDFNFCEVPSWRKARELLAQGAVGRLRHVAVTWQVENYATRMRIKSWKSSGDGGRSVTRWPHAGQRCPSRPIAPLNAASVAPDLSSARSRVSETVSTANFSGMNCRAWSMPGMPLRG